MLNVSNILLLSLWKEDKNNVFCFSKSENRLEDDGSEEDEQSDLYDDDNDDYNDDEEER